MANVKDFMRLKESIIRMNLDKDAAEERAEKTAVLLKDAIKKQDEAEKELADYVARLKLRKDKLKVTEKLLQDAAWKLKMKRQEIRRKRGAIVDMKNGDTKSGDEMTATETTLKRARSLVAEGNNMLQKAQQKHQAILRELEACKERGRKAEARAKMLSEHLEVGQARHEELRQTYEERGEVVAKLAETVSSLEEAVKQADNRTEAANRDKVVKENEVGRLRKEIEKIAEEKAKLLSSWNEIGDLADAN